jgi:ArsR family transcriptional regulator
MAIAVDMARLRPAAEKAATLLRTLGNPDRLLLMCELSQGELCVSELAERTGIVQPSLSQQLCVLREHRLVRARREGKQVYYSIAGTQAPAVMKTLYGLYCGGR